MTALGKEAARQMETLSQDEVEGHANHALKSAKNSSVPVQKGEMLYTLDETPPWYTCILMAFQVGITNNGWIK